MPDTPTKILTPKKAWTCAAMNLLAFPGAGTVIAGKKVGYVQAVLMMVGFVMTMYFVWWYCLHAMGAITDPNLNEEGFRQELAGQKWIGKVGGLLTGAAWFWSLFSSLRFLTEARRHGQPPVLQNKEL